MLEPPFVYGYVLKGRWIKYPAQGDSSLDCDFIDNSQTLN